MFPPALLLSVHPSSCHVSYSYCTCGLPFPAVIPKDDGCEGSEDNGDDSSNGNHVWHDHRFLPNLDSDGDDRVGYNISDGNKEADA